MNLRAPLGCAIQHLDRAVVGPPPNADEFQQTGILNTNEFWLADLISRSVNQLPDMVEEAIEWEEASNTDFRVVDSIITKLRG
jgi:hypothetical protein